MTKPATRHPKPPATPEERPRRRLNTPAAPTLLLDLSPAFLEALRGVAPKERRPRIAYVLAVLVGIAVYVLYCALVHPVLQRMKHVSPATSTSARASAMAADPNPNRSNATRGPQRRASR